MVNCVLPPRADPRSLLPLPSWTAKTLSIALVTFIAAYIGFFILCFVAYASSPNAEPVPALLLGTPVGASDL
jgi:hypothetical protein